MAKKTSLEADLKRLKSKVAGQSPSADDPDRRVAFRRLRKRLKRAQRKHRRLTLRKQQARPKAKEGATA